MYYLAHEPDRAKKHVLLCSLGPDFWRVVSIVYSKEGNELLNGKSIFWQAHATRLKGDYLHAAELFHSAEECFRSVFEYDLADKCRAAAARVHMKEGRGQSPDSRTGIHGLLMAAHDFRTARNFVPAARCYVFIADTLEGSTNMRKLIPRKNVVSNLEQAIDCYSKVYDQEKIEGLRARIENLNRVQLDQ